MFSERTRKLLHTGGLVSTLLALALFFVYLPDRARLAQARAAASGLRDERRLLEDEAKGFGAGAAELAGAVSAIRPEDLAREEDEQMDAGAPDGGRPDAGRRARGHDAGVDLTADAPGSRLVRARACAINGDQLCVIRELTGATSRAEMDMLIQAYRDRGNLNEALPVMRRYVADYATSPRANGYRQILNLHPEN